MNLTWSKRAWDEYSYWQDNDKKKVRRINALVKDIARHPFEGLGEPEPLKHDFSGYWSRRIDREHRLVYKTNKDDIYIFQCRYHY